MSWVAGARSARTASAVVSAAGAARRVERRGDRQQLVDRRRLGRALAEAVAFGQRERLLGADAIDEAIEVVAEPRVGAGAGGRLEQDRHRAIELAAGLVEVAVGQLTLAGGVVAFGGGDERGDGIRCRAGGRRGRRCGLGGRAGGGRHRRLSRAAAATGAAEKNQAPQPSDTGRSNHWPTPFGQDYGGAAAPPLLGNVDGRHYTGVRTTVNL